MLTISRGILALIGVVALLSSIGTMTSGSNVDIVIVLGPVLGLLALGAALWTTEAGMLRAVVVWLGVLAVGVGAVVLLVNAVMVAIARVRAGPLGT